MKTVNIRWNVELETWFIAEIETQFEQALEQNQWSSFDEWAAKQADLSAFRFILSGENYICRWLTLPGVQPRHINKALPFALEESFIDDIGQYHLVTSAKAGKFTHQVYCGKTDVFERLIEVCALHHIQLRQLIPETSLIPDNCLLHQGEYWLVNIPSVAEAKIHESALTAYLEAIILELNGKTIESIIIIDKSLDAANLVKMQIETSFSDSFSKIEITHGSFEQQRDQALAKECKNLLTAQFRAAEVKVDSPAAWWKPIAILAACWAVFSFTQTAIENKQLIDQERQVKEATIALYKNLFPGERIRSLERQVRNKVKGGGKKNLAEFMALLEKTTTAYQKMNQTQQVTWKSVRFNDRQSLLVVDLTATTIADIQQFKSALEDEDLIVEIASATNENDKVKGRIKIGAQS